MRLAVSLPAMNATTACLVCNDKLCVRAHIACNNNAFLRKDVYSKVGRHLARESVRICDRTREGLTANSRVTI